jgi:sugar phosphate isomerase/epimerase
MLIGAMNHPAEDVFSEIAWMADLGLDFIDLTLEPPRAASWQVDGTRVASELQRKGMKVVGHTAWYLPMASPIEEIRRGALRELCRCIDVFAAAGAHWMNLHPDRFSPWHPRSFYIQRNIEIMQESVDSGASKGVGIMIENLPGDFNNPQQLSDLLDPIPQLGLHLDIGHANLQVPMNSTPEILRVFGKRLRHVHLHDNKGGREDLHLPLGAGTLNLPDMVGALKGCGYDDTITLEVFTKDRRLLAFSREVLQSVWSVPVAASR